VTVIKKPWVKHPPVAAVVTPVEAAPPVAPLKPALVTPAPPPIRVQPVAQKVVVRSEPSGATVSVDGRPMGPTPALLTLSLPQEVFVSMKGYHTSREVLSSPGEVTIRMQAEQVKHSTGKTTPTKVTRPVVEKEKEKEKEKPNAHFKEGLD